MLCVSFCDCRLRLSAALNLIACLFAGLSDRNNSKVFGRPAVFSAHNKTLQFKTISHVKYIKTKNNYVRICSKEYK